MPFIGLVCAFAISAVSVSATANVRGRAASPLPAAPQRIMSMNQCVDMLVLQLADRERIASVTYLARRGMREIDPALAEGVAVNHGAAEEILDQKPDLILAGDFSTAMTREVARRAGAPIVEIKSAASFDDIRAITRQVGAAVGEAARAEALVADMDATLARLAATAPTRPWDVVVWNGESVPGERTLAGAIVRAAGGRPIGARYDSAVYSTFGLEELLVADPDFMLFADDGGREPSVLSAAMRHRVLKRKFGARMIAHPQSLFRCGVPQSATAAAGLRAAFERAGERT